MADKDQYNDEYQFADLDAINPDTGDESGSIGEGLEGTEPPRQVATDNPIKRNVIIVVALLIFALIIYKGVGLFSAEKKVSANRSAPVLTPVAQQAPIQAPPAAALVQAPPPPPSVDTNVTQKLSALELSQQSMRTDVSSVSDKLGGISNNLNAIIAKISELNGVIANLNTKVDEQSREIDQLTIRREEAKKASYSVHKEPHYPKYHIQAVIPGRAWLIATNGATLTVREGTVVAGYGMVSLIDPNQGRVMTSSGQVIRFSQEDS